MFIKHLFIFYNIFLFTSGTVNSKKDFRFISYQDLQLSFNKFYESGVTTYSQLLFDIARNQVLVGARDVLYRLALPHLQLLENSTWPSLKNTTKLCLDKGQSEKDCHNYIKILLTDGERLFVCGTNSFLPICTWREMENITHVLETMDGRAKCPYNPTANVTSLITQDGGYYIGGPTDFSGSDFAIYRSIGRTNTTRTKQYDSLWLNEPQFVGSFETDRYVYFLFKEAAVEYMNCGKIIYSRIARVCKKDGGGQLFFKDNWSTFLKARLTCSVSGDYPFYFDEIQSASFVPEKGILYATFTTPANSIAGSAICAFNLSAINDAFSGPFKYQKHTGGPWEKHANVYSDHFECKGSHGKHLETFKYQLVDNPVQATTTQPLFVAELERFAHISVDVLSTKLHSTVYVIYVSTLDGLIKKLTVLPRTQETCVVEIWQPVPDARIPIQSIQYLKETNSVYVGTESALLRIPSHHCRRHVSRDSCINAMDPYCGWNELEDACTTAPNSNTLEKYWHQSVTSCPVLNAVVDGGWSSWSEWAPCTHRISADPSSTDECLCQARQCNNPAPQNGGRSCAGPSIAVTNCTAHGGWTAWSAWSECSATCGNAVKTRTRTCTNPAPAHGGRVCVGQDRSEAFCSTNPPCPVLKPPAQDGNWGPWGDWDPCSAPCGRGFRKRLRRCDNPAPVAGGSECIGCNVEYETCNPHQCPEQVKHTAWSQWFFVTNSTGTTRNEFVRKRFKYTCKGPAQDAAQLSISHKEQERVCNSDICPDEVSRWSEWSECSVTCGGGSQERTRLCDKRSKCPGPNHERRPCNEHACRSEWGCWSDWSPCSVTCGWGIRKRFRGCLGGSCKGDNVQEEPCEVISCGTLLGWDTWTEWSVCDGKHEQHRKRNCRSQNPGPSMCQGPSVETRICNTGEAWPSVEEASTSPVIAAYVALGFAIGFIIPLCYCLYKKRKKTRIPSSPHYMSAKQNPYIAVPFQERPTKKQSAHASNSILNNVHNGTIKSVKYDYDTATMKRNSHGLNNGHTKMELLIGDDKLYYG